MQLATRRHASRGFGGSGNAGAVADGNPLSRMVATLRSVLRFKRPELHPVSRRIDRSINVADMRRIARRRLPRGVFDYIDGGAEDERTLAANTDSFAATTFRPRVLRDISTIDPSTTLFGRSLPFPLVLSPTGFTRIANPQGELAVARAAARAGVPYSLSTLATRSIEEVAAVSDGRQVVPGVRVARPGPGRGPHRPGDGVGLRGDHPHRRQRAVRSPRTRRPARVRAPTDDRTGNPARRDGASQRGHGRSSTPSRSGSPTSPDPRSPTGRARSSWPTTSIRSTSGTCRGTTSAGSVPHGTGRSW